MSTNSAAPADAKSGAAWGLGILVAVTAANAVLSILAAINLVYSLVYLTPELESKFDVDDGRFRTITLENNLPYLLLHLVLLAGLVAAFLIQRPRLGRWRSRSVLIRAGILLLPALVVFYLLDIAIALARTTG